MENQTKIQSNVDYRVWAIIVAILFFQTLMLTCNTAHAQTKVKLVGNELVTASRDTTVNHSLSDNATLTQYTWRDSRGKLYEVYLSQNDKYFVIRTSQKTLKQYRYYLEIEK